MLKNSLEFPNASLECIDSRCNLLMTMQFLNKLDFSSALLKYARRFASFIEIFKSLNYCVIILFFTYVNQRANSCWLFELNVIGYLVLSSQCIATRSDKLAIAGVPH